MVGKLGTYIIQECKEDILQELRKSVEKSDLMSFPDCVFVLLLVVFIVLINDLIHITEALNRLEVDDGI